MAITQGQIKHAKAKLKDVAKGLESQGMSPDEAIAHARTQYPDEAQLEAVEAVLFPPNAEPATEETTTAAEEPVAHDAEPEPKHKHKADDHAHKAKKK